MFTLKGIRVIICIDQKQKKKIFLNFLNNYGDIFRPREACFQKRTE